jgi:hypothetical protein
MAQAYQAVVGGSIVLETVHITNIVSQPGERWWWRGLLKMTALWIGH